MDARLSTLQASGESSSLRYPPQEPILIPSASSGDASTRTEYTPGKSAAKGATQPLAPSPNRHSVPHNPPPMASYSPGPVNNKQLRYTWFGPAHGRATTHAPANASAISVDSPWIERLWGGTPVLDVSNHSLPHGWMRFVRLDGTAYYCDTRHRVAIPDDITQPSVYEKYLSIMQRVMCKITNLPEFRRGWHTLVVKDLTSADGPTVFVLDYENGTYTDPLINSQNLTAVHVEFKTEKYWNALRDFPMHLIAAPRDIDVDFLGALSFGASERILEWNDTSYPFSDEQSRRLVQVYRDLKYDLDHGIAVVPAFTYHIARTMSRIEEARRKANFGTYDAQLYRSVVSESVGWKVKAADVFLMWVLFGVHRMYRIRLQGVRVKGEVYLTDFRQLINHFLAEWSDSNLLATVFVGANIAFIAVPGITRFQQTASLASTIFSILSVVAGVHHVWHHRTKTGASIDEAQKYMSHGGSSSSHDSDLALTACFLAIPLVSLLYAVLSFTIALGAFCIQSSGNMRGRILLSVVLGVLGTAGISTLLFFWHAWRGPRTSEVSEEDTCDVVDYGWTTQAKKLADATMGFLRRRQPLKEVDTESKDSESI